MVPLMVVLSPIVMVDGEAVIEIEPGSLLTPACTMIDVKTSAEANSKAVREAIDRFLKLSRSLRVLTHFVKSYYPLLNYLV